MKTPALAAFGLALSLTLPAQALQINSPGALPGPTGLVDFESFDGLLTTGPLALGPDVTFTGDAGSEIGAFIRDLGDNGAWGVGNNFAASGFIGELRFTFNGVSAGAGAFVNHFASDPLPFAIVVSAYGDNNLIIETYTVTVDTAFDSYNQGIFLGITRPTADIRSLGFKGVGIVVDNLTYTQPVPEPGTLGMLAAGLGVVGWLTRRRSR